MAIRIPVPRVLPLTIMAMAALLTLKSLALVRAAAAEAPAHAEAAKPKAEEKPAAKAPEKAPEPVVAIPAEPPVSEAERNLLQDLRHRRAELDAREATIGAREAVLAAAEKRIAVRVDELSALQLRLEALEKQRGERDEARWSGLVKLYESMKPRDAATIFNDLDMPVLLQVVDRMKDAKAALVLAAMQPERARQVTAELAQLRARANAAPGPAKTSG